MSTKPIITHRTRKRASEDTQALGGDLSRYVVGAFEIWTDGFNAFSSAIVHAFGEYVAHGVADRTAIAAPEGSRRFCRFMP